MSDNKPSRLSVTSLIGNLLQDLANADRGMLGTLLHLTYRPGRVVRTYLYEDRTRYIRPTKYLLVALSVLTVIFVVAQFRYGMPIHEYLTDFYREVAESQLQDMETRMLANVENTPEDRQWVAERIGGYTDFMVDLNKTLTKYSSYLMVALLPFQSLLLWLAFPRREYNYAEVLAANTYLSAHQAITSVVLLPFLLLIASPETLAFTLMIVSILQLAYYLIALIPVFVRSFTDVLIALGMYLAFVAWFIVVLRTLYYVYDVGVWLYQGGSIYSVIAFIKLLVVLLFFAIVGLAIRWRAKGGSPRLYWAFGTVCVLALAGRWWFF